MRGLVRGMLRKRWYCLVLTAALSAWAPSTVLAQETQRVPVEQATTQQKAEFVGNLVTDSVVAQTIEKSGDEAAMVKLARARQMVAEARAQLASGQIETANKNLDAALKLVNAEVRRLSQRELKQTRQKEAYDKRLQAVGAFLSAFERVAAEKKLSNAAAAQMDDLRQLVEEAEALAASGRLEEAIRALELAYKTARGDIKNMREGETLTRTLHFETAEEEYSYERDRNDSHVMLLRFAISEKDVPKNRLKRIEELRQRAMEQRALAEAQADAGGHADAIVTLTQSTNTYLKAIRMSGIWVPG